MASNRCLEIKDAVDAARARLSLIRQGILPGDGAEWMPRFHGPKGRVHGPSHHSVQRNDGSVRFHIPATRSHRLTSATGATSFHFSHRSISKVTFATCQEGVRVKPGAARAHGRYVERQDAVALLDPAFVSEKTSKALDGASHNYVTTPRQEYREHDYTHDHQIDQWLGRGLVEDIAPSESGLAGPPFAGPNLGTPVGDALADARVRLLSRRDVVRHGSATHGLLRSASDVSLETGPDFLGLRQPTQGDRYQGGRLETPSLYSPSDAAGHDNYIGRSCAVAIQPDGTRALLTNIDADDGERALFWSCVEEREAVGRGHQMSLRMADNPDFWTAAAAHKECPSELRAVIATAPPDETIRFDIESTEQMLAFLGTQSGWVPPTRKRKLKGGGKPFAELHKARNGRTQYRIVGELPDELDVAGRFAIMREFCGEFTRRGLPFVAVMHAPDHKNDEKNWHFHLIYYDRPCRRISSDDIGQLTKQGYRAEHLKPGMWDFTVVTPKKNRSNGKAVPLTQNKDSDVTADGWIPKLRHQLSEITNRHLAIAGIDRRVDPRRYEEIGIIADPQQHLGTSQAAAETRGEATQVGCDNEQRQWTAIMAEGQARLNAALEGVEEQVKTEPKSEQAYTEEQERARVQFTEVARLEHMAFCLEQDIDRARSRAAAVQRKNRQLLEAYDVDLAAGTARERQEARALVEDATSYLAHLDVTLGADVELPALARQAADQARRALTNGSAGRVGGDQAQNVVRAPIQRPQEYPLQGGQQPLEDRSDQRSMAQELAKQGAIAAALRGQGR